MSHFKGMLDGFLLLLVWRQLLEHAGGLCVQLTKHIVHKLVRQEFLPKDLDAFETYYSISLQFRLV